MYQTDWDLMNVSLIRILIENSLPFFRHIVIEGYDRNQRGSSGVQDDILKFIAPKYPSCSDSTIS